MGGTPRPIGPDLTVGIAEDALADGALLEGHVGESPVLLARRGADVFAIDALCTHYGGLLRDGLIVGDTVRCPWHHACFSLRSGEAVAPPAVAPVRCWRVERREGRLRVRERAPAGVPGARTALGASSAPAEPRAAGRAGAGTGGARIVIVGGGAAGFGAAEMLRREGYDGEVTIVSAEDSPPYDRPNLSKDYLAGAAPEEWVYLRTRDALGVVGVDIVEG
ncbi:MAG: Rieske 2Fe-2S domain-containing protein, partial [Steroidobacteraceae bacterium]